MVAKTTVECVECGFMFKCRVGSYFDQHQVCGRCGIEDKYINCNCQWCQTVMSAPLGTYLPKTREDGTPWR